MTGVPWLFTKAKPGWIGIGWIRPLTSPAVAAGARFLSRLAGGWARAADKGSRTTLPAADPPATLIYCALGPGVGWPLT